MRTIFCACVVAVVVLNACSSGKSTFERGNYYEAVITSVNRLRKNSDHKKSVETLRQAYPMAVAFYEDRAKTSLASSERFKWSEIVRSYTFINNMYDDIKRCPGALAVIPNPINYFSRLQEARQNAAEEQYAAGILALQGGTRENAKQAYGFFKTTNEYVPGYKEVNEYLKAALDAATVKIVVEQIPVHSKSVGVSADFFNDKISEFVHSAGISEFVKFYSRPEAQKIKLNPDHIIQLQFDEFAVGEVYRHEKEIQLTKDSVVMGTYISPTTTAPQTTPAKTTTPVRDGFASQGTPVVVVRPATPPANQPTAGNNQPTDGDKAAIELAEKRRLEQEQVEKVQAEKLRAEKEAAENERIAKDAAEKARAAQAEADRAAKEAAEKSLAEKAAAEKEAAEKERIAKDAAEKARAAQAEADRAAKEAAEKSLAEKAAAEKEAAEKERIAKDAAEKERVAKAEAERAAKEAAEKAAAEKTLADKQRAEKEKIEKELRDKGKYVDPTISSDDTLNVKDPVVICHMPPGNKTNSRTLKINRSALKAHLAHGDSEGSCDTNKPDQKGKPADDSKGNSGDDKKNKPQDEKKGKGPGGSARIESDPHGFLVALNEQDIILASSEKDPYSILRYMIPDVAAGDTNKVYGTVKATLYQYTKTTTSKGIISFRILDAKTGALLSVEKMPGEYVWKSEWATFNGDERALSPQQFQLTKQKEVPAPAAQELFIEFTRPIYDQITTKIKDFYKGY